MFDMMPYGWNRSQSLLDSFADFEKNFFGEMGRSFSGFNKEDIKVEAHDGRLTISAKHEENQDEKDEKSGQYIRRERRYGSFERSFSLNGVDAKNIQGSYQDGVLKLTLPKEQPTVPETHRIEIH